MWKGREGAVSGAVEKKKNWRTWAVLVGIALVVVATLTLALVSGVILIVVAIVGVILIVISIVRCCPRCRLSSLSLSSFVFIGTVGVVRERMKE
jgi:uncharacterized membrane protein HdeD (DUF308 family)